MLLIKVRVQSVVTGKCSTTLRMKWSEKRNKVRRQLPFESKGFMDKDIKRDFSQKSNFSSGGVGGIA